MIFLIIPTHGESIATKRKMFKETRKYFPDDEIIHVRDVHGKGKGWAVRTGFKRALKMSRHYEDMFCYIDGDLDIHPIEIKKLADRCTNEVDIVVGTKGLSGNLQRKIITWLSRKYIKFMFGLDFDTQTGLKIFRKHAIFLNKNNGFLFDIEMLSKAKQAGMIIKEVPIKATLNKNVKLSALIKTFIESIKIRIRY
jgi:glycosyltransferase involved in cell wall biosynthesis